MALTTRLQKFILDELSALVRIPSVSFPGFDLTTLDTSAKAVADLLKRVGYQNVEILTEGKSPPYIVAEYIVDPKLPTALLYAHHDVQPYGREEIWESPPFEPTERNGRLYGRGASDDKAGVLGHAAALAYYLKPEIAGGTATKPPINLKVVIEGEEEVGSANLFPFLQKNRERLKADVIVVSDTLNIDVGVPSLTTSLRGLVICRIEVKSLKAPLHSGAWGGGVIDPTQALIKMIAAMTDENGNINLKSVSKKPTQLADKKIPVGRELFAEQAGVLKTESVPEDMWTKVWYEPSFSVNAFQASSEKLANNIICDRAFAKIGIRLTANEQAKSVAEELEQKLRSLCPQGLELNVKAEPAADAWAMDPHSSQNRWAFAAAEKALEKSFGHPVVYIGCGGSIPFIDPFAKAFEAPVITLGVEDPYSLAHSENESVHIGDLYKIIEGEIYLFEEIANAKR